MTEHELAQQEMQWPKTREELMAYYDELLKENDDYGKSVYIMSNFALAAFNLAASDIGASGFQAGYAQMVFLMKAKRMKSGFRILDYDNLLYPQYKSNFDFDYDTLIIDKLDILGPQAEALLQKADGAEEVKEHWEKIVKMWKERGDKNEEVLD